jgi:hypothetical protein
MSGDADCSSHAFVAKQLFAANLLTKPDLESVLIELRAEGPGGGKSGCRSALHVLQRQGFRNIGKMLTFLARDSGVPLIPLARFVPQAKPFLALGRDFAVERGALPFDALAGEPMVALLNPYDVGLQEEIRETFGKRCLFYLASANDFDATLEILCRDAKGGNGGEARSVAAGA